MVNGDRSPSPAPVSAAERRAFVRVDWGEEAFCQDVQATPGRTRILARVRDVSCSGLCLILRQRVEQGASLQVEVQRAEGAFSEALRVDVLYVRERADGSFRAGCGFPTPLTPEELQALL